jgi:ectoine hydroxylase-related dioxygenase (phytanoyl-CoA dioxygenase family)
VDDNMPSIGQQLRSDFLTHGFAAVEDLFTGAEVARLAADLEEALRHRRAEEPKPVAARTTLNRQFTHCYNVWEDHPAVRPFVFDERVCSVAAGLLGASTVRLFVDQTFFKDVRAEATSRHQDCTRWPVRGNLLTAWIALDDVTQESGALAYVPGSHAVGPSSWLDLVTGRQWTAAEQELINRPPVFVPVRAGSVLFHHSCTFHLSAPNQTERRRRAFAIAYAADGAKRSLHLPYPILDWDGIAVGAPLDGPRNPVAWPRTDGALPHGPPPPPTAMPGWPFP